MELVYHEARLIFDAGTGILPLGKNLVKEHVQQIDLFISHLHIDHIGGLPFFDPIYQKDKEITIWAPQGEHRSLEETLKAFFAPEFFPVQLSDLKAKIEFRNMRETGSIQKGDLHVAFHRVNHPSVTCCTKIKTPHQTIAYVTDNEVLRPFTKEQEALVQFLKGCDLLIHECQYFPEEYIQKKGWGHSCLVGALEFVHRVKPKKWLIVHHDPTHTDIDLENLGKKAREVSEVPFEWIRDGHVVELL
jgi:ribonuclease BN (tRNA processing enzyme)